MTISQALQNNGGGVPWALPFPWGGVTWGGVALAVAVCVGGVGYFSPTLAALGRSVGVTANGVTYKKFVVDMRTFGGYNVCSSWGERGGDYATTPTAKQGGGRKTQEVAP